MVLQCNCGTVPREDIIPYKNCLTWKLFFFLYHGCNNSTKWEFSNKKKEERYMWCPATYAYIQVFVAWQQNFRYSTFAYCYKFQHHSLYLLMDQAFKCYDTLQPHEWNVVHYTRLWWIRINWVLNLFTYIWVIETTWLDLPLSVQKCA